jgi:hypothetical protein
MSWWVITGLPAPGQPWGASSVPALFGPYATEVAAHDFAARFHARVVMADTPAAVWQAVDARLLSGVAA